MNVQLVTINPLTSSSLGPLTRLPTLILCPGPHITFLMFMFFEPRLIDTQSSPVAIVESMISILLDEPMCIPLVSGLSLGAIIWM